MNQKKLIIIFIATICLTIVSFYLTLNINRVKDIIDQMSGNTRFAYKPKEYINRCEGKPINLSDIAGSWALVPVDIPENVNIILPELVLKTNGSFIFKGWKSSDFISHGVISKVNKPNTFNLEFNDNVEYWEKFVNSSLKENNAKIEGNKAIFLIDVSQFSYPDGTCQYRFWLWGWQFEQINK